MAGLLGAKWHEISLEIDKGRSGEGGSADSDEKRKELSFLERHLQTLEVRARLHARSGFDFNTRYKHACKGESI